MSKIGRTQGAAPPAYAQFSTILPSPEYGGGAGGVSEYLSSTSHEKE